MQTVHTINTVLINSNYSHWEQNVLHIIYKVCSESYENRLTEGGKKSKAWLHLNVANLPFSTIFSCPSGQILDLIAKSSRFPFPLYFVISSSLSKSFNLMENLTSESVGILRLCRCSCTQFRLFLSHFLPHNNWDVLPELCTDGSNLRGTFML